MKIIFEFERSFIIPAVIPKQGAKNGSQYLKITMSGFSFAILNPVVNQLMGLTESIILLLSIFSTSSDFSNCVLPGNKKFGYNLLKLKILTCRVVLSNVLSHHDMDKQDLQ